MFSKQAPDLVFADLSTDIQDEQDWKVGTLKTFDFPLNISAVAIEPISRLLAVGTSDGIIHVYGRPGVECRIKLPQALEVRFLQFAISTFNIICLDGGNELHVYSLLEIGKPRYVTSARFDNINSITSSPSHSHIFLATRHGDVKTYDLMCLRKSPYSIPNLWKLYEEKMVSSGVPMLTPPDPSTTEAVDVVVHPRNLDLLFVAYAGGIILTDLTERSTIRAYELMLQPGAPGGAGYDALDILSHRRSMVTSVAIHPSGHFFAAGYADGSIAFWAVDDDNKPLLVRTLDTLDVNIPDPTRVESLLSTNQKAKTTSFPSSPEPIFKLSWSGFPNSDPRSGETSLTILGGLTSDKPPGLTVFLFPPFNPPEAPTDPPVPTTSIHPFYRKAMCQSLVPKKTFFYETRGLVQDYLLLPHTTPHFAGNFDPYAILLITEVENTRTIEAYQYPPPGFIEAVQVPPTVEKSDENEVEDQNTPDGLLSPPPPAPLPKSPRHMNYTPASLRTPFPLLSGNSGIIGGRLLNVDKDVYQGFIDNTPPAPSLDLKGGQAYAETTSEMKLLKYQPHRILVTYNRDLSIRFFDFSSQLLLPNLTSNPLLENDWPEVLPKLTIKLDDVFDDSRIADLLVTPIQNISIQSIEVAPEALECAVILQSGEILVYHPRESRPKPSSPNISADAQIVLLDHIYSPPGSKLVPFFMLTAEKGPIETCTLSDIGFLAVSYQSGALLVIDMRGPRIMFAKDKIKKNRHSVISRPHIHLPGGAPGSLGHDSEIDVIQSLTWTVCSLDKDPHLSVRLISIHQSGDAEAYTLLYSGNPKSWNIADEPVTIKAMADPIHNGTFVLDKKTGAPWRADRGRFAASFQNIAATDISGRPIQPQCMLVTVGAKGARSSFNVSGEKIGKVEWGNKAGTVQTAQIVEHLGSRALVVQTDKCDGLIYSLPYLEYICTVQIPVITPLPLIIDDVGDFIALVPDAKYKSTSPIQSLVYGTLFIARRTYMPPDIDFASTRAAVPPQPQPVSLGPASLLGSWFSYKQTLSGNQIDELLGGPDRPIPQKSTSERDATTGQENSAGSAAAGFAASAATVQTNIYNRLTSAMSERGQLLGDLEERFNSLEEGSRSMVAQAKKLAAQQTAKSWFGF